MVTENLAKYLQKIVIQKNIELLHAGSGTIAT